METGCEKLKRKQSSSHDHWLAVWERISAAPDHSRALTLLDDAAELTHARLRHVQRAGWAWSGGKDSIGLEAVLAHAGLAQLEGMGALTALEFPTFERWYHEHVPDSVTTWTNHRIDLAWLASKPAMLFPATRASRWFPVVQKAAQKRFTSSRRLDVLIGGWRGQDGNYLGTGDRMYEYVTPEGVVKFSPIAQWSHEDLLTVIAHCEMPLPPIYSYPRGFPIGTGPWPSRPRLASLADSWDEVHLIHPELVHDARAAGIPSAADYLEER